MGCQLCKDFFEPGEMRVQNDVVGTTAPASLRSMKLEDIPLERLSMASVELEAVNQTIYLRKKRRFKREGSLDFDDPIYTSLRALLSEPVGRFYLFDFAKAKNLPHFGTRFQFLSIMYKLSNEFMMEGRFMDDVDNSLESDEERSRRLDLWIRDVVDRFGTNQGGLDQILISDSEKSRFAQVVTQLSLLDLTPFLPSTAGESKPDEKRLIHLRTQVHKIFEPLAHAVFRYLVDSGAVRQFREHSEYKRYKAKFNQCYNNLNHEDFDFMQVLGKGSFGRVLRVRKKTTQVQYAMKIMSKRKILSGAENAAQVTIERNVLVECNNPSVIRVHFAFHTTRALFLVLDLLEGGTLMTAMHSCGGILPQDMAQFFTAQIVLGLEHLHDHGILFRDLKPLNVLLDRKGNAVLTDMGLACKFRQSKPGVLYNGHVFASDGDDDVGHTSHANLPPTNPSNDPVSSDVRRPSIPILPKEKLKCVGTFGFRAPELMNTETDRTVGYGPAVDYFALGATLCYLVSGKMPFRQRNASLMEGREKPKDTERRLLKGSPKIPADLPEACQDMIRGLLILDPLLRYGDADLPKLKAHPFFAQLNWTQLAERKLVSPYQVGVKKHAKDEMPQFPSVHAAMAQFAHENVLEMFGGENEMKDEYTHVPRAEQRHFRTWDFIPDDGLEAEWQLAEEFLANNPKPFRRKRKVNAARLGDGGGPAPEQLDGMHVKV